MSAGLYETWARRLRFSFAGPRWGAIFGAFGKVLGDNSLRDIRNAVLSHMPSYAEPDANGITANDRQIEKGPAESDGSFAARLVAFLDQWRLGGTPLGLLIQLYYTGFPGAVFVQQNGRALQITGTPDLADLVGIVAPPSWLTITELSGNPKIGGNQPILISWLYPWWIFDAGLDSANRQFNSRFAILFPADVDDPALGTAANLTRIQRIIAAWRRANSTCVGIWVSSSGWLFGWPKRLFGVGGTFATHEGTSTKYAAE